MMRTPLESISIRVARRSHEASLLKVLIKVIKSYPPHINLDVLSLHVLPYLRHLLREHFGKLSDIQLVISYLLVIFAVSDDRIGSFGILNRTQYCGFESLQTLKGWLSLTLILFVKT